MKHSMLMAQINYIKELYQFQNKVSEDYFPHFDELEWNKKTEYIYCSTEIRNIVLFLLLDYSFNFKDNLSKRKRLYLFSFFGEPMEN